MFYLKIGTKDAVLMIAIFIGLVLTVVYHWSPIELIVTELAIVLAFFAGLLKPDKRFKK